MLNTRETQNTRITVIYLWSLTGSRWRTAALFETGTAWFLLLRFISLSFCTLEHNNYSGLNVNQMQTQLKSTGERILSVIWNVMKLIKLTEPWEHWGTSTLSADLSFHQFNDKHMDYSIRRVWNYTVHCVEKEYEEIKIPEWTGWTLVTTSKAPHLHLIYCSC